MESPRLKSLYARRLASAQSGRIFPTQFVLNKTINYFPQKPDSMQFDFLEIGPGQGDFLLHLAEQHPTKKILAIEIDAFRFHKISEKIKKLKLDHVTLIHGDARIPLAKDLHNTKLEKIFVLFPDPWPRNRHRHKRLLSTEFLTALCARLQDNGEFTLATDVRDYADWVIKNLGDVPQMKNMRPSTPTTTLLPDLVTTSFEKRWREYGRTCHYVRFTKTPTVD